MKNRFVLTIVLAMVTCQSGLVAATFQCLVRKQCPEGTPPGKCCDPPPCEFYDQIRMKRALQSMFANRKLRRRMIQQANGDKEAAAKLLHDAIKAKAAKLGSKLKCGWDGPVQPPPSFETSDDCRINGPSGSMSRETAHKTLNTCAEFIDAAYDHEDYHKAICFNSNSTERAHLPIDPFADEEVRAYQKEIDRLAAEMKSYWRACSPAADAKTAREVASLGIKALKKSRSK